MIACSLVILGALHVLAVAASAPKCDIDKITDILGNQSPAAEMSGSFEKIAAYHEALAREREKCYQSGRVGGKYFGNSPLDDLLDAAGNLQAAADDWSRLHNVQRSCADATRAIQLYIIVQHDQSVSTPAWMNDSYRRIAPVGIKSTQRLTAHCPKA